MDNTKKVVRARKKMTEVVKTEEILDEDNETASRYVRNYLDTIEELPDDLQRQFSRIIDMDAFSQEYFGNLKSCHEVLAQGEGHPLRATNLLLLQQVLIKLQDIEDDKIQLMQTIHDLIENRARDLDIDNKSLKPKLEQENSEPSSASNSTSVSSNSKTCDNTRPKRRGRKPKKDVSLEATDTSVLSENQSSNLPSTSTGTETRRKSARGAGKKKKPSSHEDSPPRLEEELEMEPEEPLYCVCNRISFGKMIMCDNDGCVIEWFHFPCVSLTSKPKGKWYCPQCRGNKPNIMKPKLKSKFR